MSDILKVTMLGDFSIEYGENKIDESANRQRKVWLLLGYLIYSRSGRVTRDSLMTVLQGTDFGEVDDPAGRLKAILYRARAALNGLYPNAGHELITLKSNTYCWNGDVPTLLDVDEFERSVRESMKTESKEEKLALLTNAFELYKGDFLPKHSAEPWVMPINSYYHQKYLELCDGLFTLMENAEQFAKCVEFCRRALVIEPYSEALYCHLMTCLLAMGDREGVISTFEGMSELLFDTFGVMPGDEARALYRKAGSPSNEKGISPEAVHDRLKEQEKPNGAMICEYDYFRFLYQVQERSIDRTGQDIHIALLSLHGKNDLSRKSLDLAMDNLGALLLSNLRKGDVIARCSISQWVVMLPLANYENSLMVCNRVIKAFNRKYPHSPAEIRFSVHALEAPKE